MGYKERDITGSEGFKDRLLTFFMEDKIKDSPNHWKDEDARQTRGITVNTENVCVILGNRVS